MVDRTPADDASVDGTQPDQSVDLDRIRAVLDEHPVRLAVLFGSRTRGMADPESDIDLAVEFEDSVDDRGQALLELLTDLSVALDRNDVDLAVVDDLNPRVGHAAFAQGRLLCGSPDRAERHRKRFVEAVDSRQSPRSLRERFDDTLDRVDRIVGPD